MEALLAAAPAEAGLVRDFRDLNEAHRAALRRPARRARAAAGCSRRWRACRSMPHRASGLRTPAGAAGGGHPHRGLAGAGGYLARGLTIDTRRPEAAFVTTAIGAHSVYVPEVRHPVEVGAAEEAHLVQWLTKRIGADVRAPALAGLGWKLVGGRLLPDRGLPAAQFMYEDGTGRRLTLYMRKETGLNNTAFQFAERDGFGAFYWVDRPLAYAIAGRLGREELMSIANAVYGQLEQR